MMNKPQKLDTKLKVYIVMNEEIDCDIVIGVFDSFEKAFDKVNEQTDIEGYYLLIKEVQ